jgi:hypothetical protein
MKKTEPFPSLIDIPGACTDALGNSVNIQHERFTKSSVDHPGSRMPDESAESYFLRVKRQIDIGFHPADLTYQQWEDYLVGGVGPNIYCNHWRLRRQGLSFCYYCDQEV